MKTPFEHKQVMRGIMHKIIFDRLWSLCLRYVVYKLIFQWIRGEIQQHNFTCAAEIFGGRCAACAHNLSDPHMKQNHQKNNLAGHNLKMEEHSFHPPSYHHQCVPTRDFTQWARCLLFTTVFCIWGGDKPVMVTHRPTRYAHNAVAAGLWCRRMPVWRRVSWPGVLSLAPHD